ncbi:hypothetical protein [Pyrobaculum ferrireducens]|nr:hypothetical protein [Pyrobaculum ferrireducens]
MQTNRSFLKRVWDEVLAKIDVEIGREGSQKLRRLLDLPHTIFRETWGSAKAVVIGFEDSDYWEDMGDIIVKVYEDGGKLRVEVACTGDYPKTTYYCGNKVLEYEGYTKDDVEKRAKKVGVVIFYAGGCQ